MQQTRGDLLTVKESCRVRKRKSLKRTICKKCMLCAKKLVRHGDPKSMHSPATGWNQVNEQLANSSSQRMTRILTKKMKLDNDKAITWDWLRLDDTDISGVLISQHGCPHVAHTDPYTHREDTPRSHTDKTVFVLSQKTGTRLTRLWTLPWHFCRSKNYDI